MCDAVLSHAADQSEHDELEQDPARHLRKIFMHGQSATPSKKVSHQAVFVWLYRW